MQGSARLCRIVLRNTKEPQQEIRIDFLFNDGQVRGGIEYFGLWQDKGVVKCPFILSSDGEVDFGTGFDGEDRYYETNMLKKEMMIGQQVTWSRGEDETVFSVVSITPLI